MRYSSPELQHDPLSPSNYEGHDPHIPLELVKYCHAANMTPYCLPPHSTHLLQPWDAALLSALQKARLMTFSSFNCPLLSIKNVRKESPEGTESKEHEPKSSERYL